MLYSEAAIGRDYELVCYDLISKLSKIINVLWKAFARLLKPGFSQSKAVNKRAMCVRAVHYSSGVRLKCARQPFAESGLSKVWNEAKTTENGSLRSGRHTRSWERNQKVIEIRTLLARCVLPF